MKKTKINLQKIIELLERTPIIEIVCSKVGISRSTLYRWSEQDPELRQKIDVALEKGRLVINDMAESQIISGIKERNLGAAKYWLSNNNSRYKKALPDNEPEENPLTEERKAMISKAMMAWSTCYKCGSSLSDDDSERDSDYEPESIAEKEEREAKKTVSETKPIPVVERKPAPVNSKIARKLVFNPKTKKLE